MGLPVLTKITFVSALRASNSRAMAIPGNRCPPVPPPAMTMRRGRFDNVPEIPELVPETSLAPAADANSGKLKAEITGGWAPPLFKLCALSFELSPVISNYVPQHPRFFDHTLCDVTGEQR